MSGLRAALRIARRDALRSKGRSALVVAMIGLPMLGLAFADVAVRTGQLPRSEVATREMGRADLLAEAASSDPIVQTSVWEFNGPDGDPKAFEPPDRAPDIAPVLPPGSRVALRTTYYAVRLRAAGAITFGEVEQMDLFDPGARGIVRLESGTYPRRDGEVALTTNAASTLGAHVGDDVSIVGLDRTFRVTALVVYRATLSATKYYVPVATTLPSVGLVEHPQRRWAVTLPPGVRDLSLLKPLNDLGMRVTPRTWLLHPPPSRYPEPAVSADAVGVAVVAVGLATLEIVLLAGTAFAVGARRKRRELALVVATGGDRRDVRRVVLASGVVLGGVAGALGVVGGIAAAVLGRPVLERLADTTIGPLDLRPLELAAIVAIGVGTALLASTLPARAAARQGVVEGLTGRRGETRTRLRVPVLALVAVVTGAGIAFRAAGERPVRFVWVLAGAVVAELGFVACAPALVGLVGRLASRLPLSLRLAARDAARHRSRSGPAVAAVVAAVAGSVALSVYVASDTERQRRAYDPSYPSGSVVIGRNDVTNRIPDSTFATATALLPVREAIDVEDLTPRCDPNGPCAAYTLERPPGRDCDLPCAPGRFLPGGEVYVGGERLAAWATGRDDDTVARALGAGKVVVFDSRWITDGTVTFRRSEFSRTGTPGAESFVTVPAVAAEAPEYGSMPVGVMTPATADAHHLPHHRRSTVLTTTRVPSARAEARARAVLAKSSQDVELYVERGFRRTNTVVLLGLVAAGALVTIGSTAIATGLAAADSRPDLATLAAVGAAPRVRRRLAMAQAATVAALGSALGILAGLVPSISVVGARAEYPLAIPWASLLVIAVGVPLLAACVVGLVTRSRLPLERRLA